MAGRAREGAVVVYYSIARAFSVQTRCDQHSRSCVAAPRCRQKLSYDEDTALTLPSDYTKAAINTLQTGADNLVLADTNEEGANLLALQTRQSLSTTALSLSSQSDQAVLRLL